MALYREDESGEMRIVGLASLDRMDEKTAHEAIHGAEAEIAALPQVEIEPAHLFAEGLYARTILIPAGVALTGFVHKKGDLNIIHYGRIEVIGSDGIGRVIEGPTMFAGEPGLKKIGYAITDTSWTNVFATAETDLEKLELELFEEPSEGQVKPQFDFATGKIKGEIGALHERSTSSGSNRNGP